MQDSIITRKSIFLALGGSACILIVLFFSSYFDRRTKIVFCDVGQGDGAYIRVKNSFDLVIDAGPDNKMLQCLGKHMPFYDRTIEIAILTHPQKDHYFGFISILDRYKVDRFVMNRLKSKSASFTMLTKKLLEKRTNLIFPHAGTRIAVADSTLDFLWPSVQFTDRNIIFAHPKDLLGESPIDSNNFSFIFLFSENVFKVLFTGDTLKDILDGLSEKYKIEPDVIKIPHHGSKHGLSSSFLDLANPTYGVISSGKNNPYGHPTKEVLDLLEASSVKIRRTDIDGDIVFKLPD